MITANIIVTKNGIFVTGETTDIDGDYIIQVDAGTYDLEVSYPGYPTQNIKGVIVEEEQTKKVDVQLKVEGFNNDE
jgi:hypothetical protein